MGTGLLLITSKSTLNETINLIHERTLSESVFVDGNKQFCKTNESSAVELVI